MGDHVKRRAARSKYITGVRLLTSDGAVVEGETRDISTKGIFFISNKKLALKTSCNIEVNLTRTGVCIAIKISGKVVRTDKKGMGIEFTDVDKKAFNHLKRLVEVNKERE